MGRGSTKEGGKGFWSFARKVFRRFRISIWFLLLVVLSTLIYLNQSGLPDFMKKPLLARLHRKGIDLQFTRLRLRWYEGLVAENVQFGSAGTNSPTMTAREAKLSLRWRSLLNRSVQVDSLMLRDGTFKLPVPDAARPNRELVVSNIQAELRLLPGDQWVLDQFKARFSKADLRLDASLKNASAVRDWSFLKSKGSANHDAAARKLKAFADRLDQILLAETPQLEINARGDARDLRSFDIRMDANVPAARTPWGDFTTGVLHTRVRPSQESNTVSATIELRAARGTTQWGSVQDFKLSIDLAQPDAITNLVQGALRISAARARTPWASGTDFSANVHWLHAVTNPIPLWAQAEIVCTNAESKWAVARSLVLNGVLTTTNGTPESARSEWAWWTNLAPFAVEWDCKAEGVDTFNIKVRKADVSGSWLAPGFAIRSLNAELYEGKLSALGALNIDSRQASASASLDFDVRNVQHIMTEGARKWISQYTWKTPPEVAAEGRVTLPAWTNRQPDWRGEVLPSLWLSGRFNAKNGAGYRGIESDSASSHFIYSNMTWHLPDLVVIRPEGRLEAEHIASDRTHDYSWKIHSTVDPAMIRPLLQTNQTRVFQLLQLSSPPEITAEVRGRFHDYDLLSARAVVAVTNFSFRQQTGSVLHAEVLYSNKVVQVLHPEIERGEERAQADAVVADFNKQLVFITNATGNMAPLVVARAIGPKVGRALEAYQFLQPPKSRVHGVVPMHGEKGADLVFELDGGPFHWWKFHIPRISGTVHWQDYLLSLGNIDADFYWGRAWGNAVFDVSDRPGTEFMFSMTATNVLLQDLIADLSATTNKSEGWIEGTVVVTDANSDDWRTVQGHGNLKFSNGLLWDIPLFGVLSPVLDGVVPGLGSSRATDGTCTYVITNGVFRTSDLDIRTTMMRLAYKGDVDLANDYQLNARVEAELLKDVWVLGPLVSTVLWPVTKIFEFKVDGTLGSPRLEPVNVIPKLISIPFLPLRILKGIGSEPPKAERAPPPPAGPAPSQ